MFRVLFCYIPRTIVVIDLSRKKSYNNIPDEYLTLRYGKYLDWKWKVDYNAYNYEDKYNEEVDIELSDMHDAIVQLFNMDDRNMEFFRNG